MSNKGFTLIELMIVVAIIAVLVAIAVPAYQIYVTRAHLAGALAEISAGKSPFESELVSQSATSSNPASIGLAASTRRCDVDMDSSPTGFIRCTVRGNPAVNGQQLTLRRSASGEWRCEGSAGIPTAYLPGHCS